ncbi:unnamed protein product, partial [marine sediment metagenome]
AGEDIYSGDVIGLGVTPGRAYEGGAVTSGAGSAHKHTESLTIGEPSAISDYFFMGNGTIQKYVATELGGSPDFGIMLMTEAHGEKFPTITHNHPISGSIDNEALHTHSLLQSYPGFIN